MATEFDADNKLNIDRLLNGKLSLVDFVEYLQPQLTSTVLSERDHALLALAEVLERVNGGSSKQQQSAISLTSNEYQLVCAFLLKRYSDHYSLLHSTLRCTLALISGAVDDGCHAQMCVELLRVLCTNIHVPTLSVQERLLAIDVFHAALVNPAVINDELVNGFIQCVDGERDPRCLLRVFRTVCLLARQISSLLDSRECGEREKWGAQIECLFDVVACYFPVEYSPPDDFCPDITRELLAADLCVCLTADAIFVNFVIALVTQKLESDVKWARIDSLQVINSCYSKFPESVLSTHVCQLADTLRRLSLDSLLAEDELAAVFNTTTLVFAQVECWSTPVSQWCDNMLSTCIHLFFDSFDTHTSDKYPLHNVFRLLGAVGSGGKRCCKYVLEATSASIVSKLKCDIISSQVSNDWLLTFLENCRPYISLFENELSDDFEEHLRVIIMFVMERIKEVQSDNILSQTEEHKLGISKKIDDRLLVECIQFFSNHVFLLKFHLPSQFFGSLHSLLLMYQQDPIVSPAILRCFTVLAESPWAETLHSQLVRSLVDSCTNSTDTKQILTSAFNVQVFTDLICACVRTKQFVLEYTPRFVLLLMRCGMHAPSDNSVNTELFYSALQCLKRIVVHNIACPDVLTFFVDDFCLIYKFLNIFVSPCCQSDNVIEDFLLSEPRAILMVVDVIVLICSRLDAVRAKQVIEYVCCLYLKTNPSICLVKFPDNLRQKWHDISALLHYSSLKERQLSVFLSAIFCSIKYDRSDILDESFATLVILFSKLALKSQDSVDEVSCSHDGIYVSLVCQWSSKALAALLNKHYSTVSVTKSAGLFINQLSYLWRESQHTNEIGSSVKLSNNVTNITDAVDMGNNNNQTDNLLNVRIFYIWCNLIYALAMRHHPLTDELLDTALQWIISSDDIASVSIGARKFREQSVLVDTFVAVLISGANRDNCERHHWNTMMFYRQWIFTFIWTRVKSVLRRNATGSAGGDGPTEKCPPGTTCADHTPSRSACLRLVVAQLSGLPAQVIVDYIGDLVPVMVECLTVDESSTTSEAMASNDSSIDVCLQTLFVSFEQCASAIETHAFGLVARLLRLASHSPRMSRRVAALKCVAKVTELRNTHVLLPLRQSTLDALRCCVDDRKRVVREQAVIARNLWYILGSVIIE